MKDAFGQKISESDAAITHLYGYTGREYDEVTKLQYNRARYYDPKLGRWINDDPKGFDAGDANLYRYVGNGPTNGTDPSGLDEEGGLMHLNLDPTKEEGKRTVKYVLTKKSRQQTSNGWWSCQVKCW